MSFVLALLAAGATPAYPEEKAPPFYTSQEKWACTFKGFGDGFPVTQFFGVFRSHVEDAVFTDYSVVQNDSAAVVFVMSDVGETDVNGKVIKSASVTMIDKKSRDFKKSLVDLDGKPAETTGTCQPY